MSGRNANKNPQVSPDPHMSGPSPDKTTLVMPEPRQNPICQASGLMFLGVSGLDSDKHPSVQPES